MGKDFFFFLIIIHTFLSAYMQVKRASWVTRLYAECALQKMVTWRTANRPSEKTSADLRRRVLYHVSIFYVNQTNSVLNFTRGQNSADDTYVY